jgi:chemotaxis protein CheX
MQPVLDEIRDNLLEPFTQAACAALGEMAGTELAAGAVYESAVDRPLGNIAAAVELQSATNGWMILSFPQATAAALARRILAEVPQEVDDTLIQDCMGEIANVVAGQAKAMLAGTAYQFTFSLPRTAAAAGGKPLPGQGLQCLVVSFGSDLGEFAMQLALQH